MGNETIEARRVLVSARNTLFADKCPILSKTCSARLTADALWATEQVRFRWLSVIGGSGGRLYPIWMDMDQMIHHINCTILVIQRNVVVLYTDKYTWLRGVGGHFICMAVTNAVEMLHLSPNSCRPCRPCV